MLQVFTETTYSTLLHELERQAMQPPDRDVRISAFCKAMRTALEDEPIRKPIASALEQRPAMAGSYAANLLLRAFQKQLIIADPEYPVPYDTTARWQQAIGNVMVRDYSRTELLSDIAQRDVQSNVSERYKVLPLLFGLFSEQLPARPAVLDVGCSQNHGLKRLALGIPFSPIERAEAAGLDRLNRLVTVPPQLSIGLGVDISPLTSDNVAWAKYCSFYPSELLDETAVKMYSQLDMSQPTNVSFRQCNLLTTELAEYYQAFDVVLASTFMYQLSASDQKLMRAKLRQYVKPTGIIVYQDFVRVAGIHNDKLDFSKSWFAQPYSYRTIVEQAASQNGRLAELFVWENGRCRAMRMGQDLCDRLQK